MKHLKLFEEFLETEETNEGIIKDTARWIKNKLFKTKYSISYSASLQDESNKPPLTWSSHLTVYAKDEDAAREKFQEKWDEATKDMEVKPTVIVGTVHPNTKRSDRLKIKIPSRKKEEEKEKKK